MNFTEEQEQYFHEFLNVLYESNALDSVILVGSWAEYLYEKEKILSGFTSLAKTTDIDFLLRNEIVTQPANIIKPAQEKGFLYKEDYIFGTSKFWKKEFEVEFLTSQEGDGSKPVGRSPLGVNAQALTHIGFIRDNYITVSHDNFNINIPKPEAYVLQKMIINTRRGSKTRADQIKIEGILPYLNKQTFEDIYSKLYKKEQQQVDRYIGQYCPEFRTQPDNDIIRMYKSLQTTHKNKSKEVEQNGTPVVEPPDAIQAMEMVWNDFFALPKEQRKKIPWDGDNLRIAVFEDKYLAECQKANVVPNDKINNHFWKNCVDIQGYEPKYCRDMGRVR